MPFLRAPTSRPIAATTSARDKASSTTARSRTTPNSHTAGLDDPADGGGHETWTNPESHDYKLEVTLPSSTPNAAEGKTATQQFTWEARNNRWGPAAPRLPSVSRRPGAELSSGKVESRGPSTPPPPSVRWRRSRCFSRSAGCWPPATGVLVERSDSMSPALLAGEIVVTRTVRPLEARRGEILTFTDPSH